jgi:hypothetical protein
MSIPKRSQGEVHPAWAWLGSEPSSTLLTCSSGLAREQMTRKSRHLTPVDDYSDG